MPARRIKLIISMPHIAFRDCKLIAECNQFCHPVQRYPATKCKVQRYTATFGDHQRVCLDLLATDDDAPRKSVVPGLGSPDQRIDLERLSALIQRLKPLDRQVIVSSRKHGDAVSIGEITGLSPSNVAMRIHRIDRPRSAENSGRRTSENSTTIEMDVLAEVAAPIWVGLVGSYQPIE